MRATQAAVLGLVLLAALPTPTRASDTADLALQVDTYLAPLLQTNNFAGVVLVSARGETIFAKGFGLASIEQSVAHTAESRFQIASLSKPFTSASIMLLVQRGRIDLNAPLHSLLPGYPQGDQLTAHHLLSHRSGIPNINDFPEYESSQSKPHTPAQLVNYFKDKPLAFAPGERYEYSNSNYNLLAYLIEQVSGMTYGDFVEREIVQRLALPSTMHRVSMTDIVPGLANGYSPRGSIDLERAQYLDWTSKTGNGSMYSTAADLARFATAIHDSNLLSDSSRLLTFEPHGPNSGYGWFLAEANDRKIHHVNGRSPGWAAQLDYYVDEGVTVVVLSNIYASVTTPIARAVGALYFGLTPTPMPHLKAEPLTPVDAARLVGTYRFGEDYYIPNSTVTIVQKNGHLRAEYADGYPASAYIPITSTRFMVRPFWMSAEFVLGPDGNASHLMLNGFKGTRE